PLLRRGHAEDAGGAGAGPYRQARGHRGAAPRGSEHPQGGPRHPPVPCAAQRIRRGRGFHRGGGGMTSVSEYHELVRHLIAALAGRRIYPPRHPVLDRSLARLEQVLHNLMVSRDEVQLGVLGNRLLADGLPWEEQEEPLSLLSQELRARKIDTLT